MILNRQKAYDVSDWQSLYELSTETHLKQMALDTVIGRIQAACALITLDSEDHELSYRLNVRPNLNENAIEFRDKLIYRLLTDGEVLAVVVNDQMLLVDSWQVSTDVVKERTYKDIVIGDLKLRKTFKSSDVFHFKYRNNRLKRYMTQLTDTYAKLFNRILEVQMRESQLRIYAKFPGTSRKGDDNQQKFKNFLRNLETELNTKSIVVTPHQDDYSVQEEKPSYLGRSSGELGTIENVYLKNVANALNVSPLLFSGDLADVSQHTENFVIQCIQPIMEILATEINSKYFDVKESKKNKLTYNTVRLLYASEFKMAKDVEKMLGSGVWNVDDVLTLMGRSPLNTKQSKRRYLTKNLGPLDDDGLIIDSRKGFK